MMQLRVRVYMVNLFAPIAQLVERSARNWVNRKFTERFERSIRSGCMFFFSYSCSSRD